MLDEYNPFSGMVADATQAYDRRKLIFDILTRKGTSTFRNVMLGSAKIERPEKVLPPAPAKDKQNKLGKYAGLTYNFFTILEVVPNTRSSRYMARCKCGTVKSVYMYDVKNGLTKSCGCLRSTPGLHSKRPEIRKSAFNAVKKDKRPANVYLGRVYGRLTCSELIDPKKRRYLFQCSCGGSKESCIDNVANGHVSSCGCLRKESARLKVPAANAGRRLTAQVKREKIKPPTGETNVR